MTNPRRKAQIEACRQQGRADRDAGLSRNRYKLHLSTDEGHKQDGWDLRDEELRAEAEADRDSVIYDAIQEISDGHTRRALALLFARLK